MWGSFIGWGEAAVPMLQGYHHHYQASCALGSALIIGNQGRKFHSPDWCPSIHISASALGDLPSLLFFSPRLSATLLHRGHSLPTCDTCCHIATPLRTVRNCYPPHDPIFLLFSPSSSGLLLFSPILLHRENPSPSTSGSSCHFFPRKLPYPCPHSCFCFSIFCRAAELENQVS